MLNAIIDPNLLPDSFVVCVLMLTASGAGLVFLGSIEKTQLQHVFPGVGQFLLCCAMCGLAFGSVIGLGLRLGAYAGLLGAILGLSMGAAYWLHAALTALYWNARLGPHSIPRRTIAGTIFVITYGPPLLLVVPHYPRAALVIVALLLAASMVRVVVTILLIFDSWIGGPFRLLALAIPYVAGAVITLSGRELIVAAFRPGISFSTAAITLALIGGFGASLYLIIMRIARWYRSPTQINVMIWVVERLEGAWRGWPAARNGYGRLLQWLIRRRDKLIADVKHQAYLQYATLMGGVATGLGIGSLVGAAHGPPLAAGSRMLFTIEMLIAPSILGLFQSRVEERRAADQLVWVGLLFLVLGVPLLIVIYLWSAL